MDIMKQTLPALLALALTSALCLSALSLPSVIAQETPAAVVGVQTDDDVESRLAALEQELKDLKLANKKQEALLEQAVKYMESQAASGAKLSAAMDRIDSMGFTKGINFKSRELMLAAFKAHCAALQKDVPRLAKPVVKPVARRR